MSRFPTSHFPFSIFDVQSTSRVARARRGVSILESVLATFLVGVLLVAAMRTVGASVFAQYKAAERATAAMLADGLAAEVHGKRYKDSDPLALFGPEPGESAASKATFDDVDDYQEWAESPPQFADGSTMPDLTGWRRSVAVVWVDPGDLSQVILSDTGAKRITVTVEHNGSVLATRTAIRTEAP